MTEDLILRLPPNDRTMDNMIHAVTAIRGHLERGPTILRPKQIEIVHSVADIIHSGERATYLDLPTGVGKTVIFSQIVDAIQQDGHRKKILIVTDSQDLVLQTKERFDQHAPNVPVGIYYQKVKQTEQPVIVTTYASFPYFAENHAHEFDYVVFDEAHKALSEARIAHRHKFDNAVWLALTATPAYSKDKALEKHFALAYKMSVRDAIYNGLICQYRNIRVNTHYADLGKVKISTTGDYDKYSLEQEINNYSRNRSAVEFYQYAVDPYTGVPLLGTKGVANCVGIKHAYDFASLCQELIEPHTIGGKTPCVAVHGKSKDYPQMNSKLRKSILEAHRHNEIALLSQSDLLIHGHDDKEIELTLNLAPSLSLVEVQQRAGRSLRIDEKNPDKVATIVDFIDEETDERNKALMYGDVVGQASVLFPETEKRFVSTSGGGGGGGRRTLQYIDHELLKDLDILWSSEEVDAVIFKNRTAHEHALPPKQEGELSNYDVAERLNTTVKNIDNVFDRLQLKEGTEDQYFDPEDKNKDDPTLFKIVTRRHVSGLEIPCLAEDDLDKFGSIYKFSEYRNGLSALDIGKNIKLGRSAVNKILYRLELKEGTEDLYFDPEDKNKDDPTLFRIITKQSGKHLLRYLRETSLEDFRLSYAPGAKYGLKKEDEISPQDLAKMLDVSPSYVAAIFNRLQLKEGTEDRYFDPEDKNTENPTLFRIAKRHNPKRLKDLYTFYLKKHDYDKFYKAFSPPFERKKEDELSNYDLAKKLDTIPQYINAVFDRLQLKEGTEDLYFDPEDKNKDGPALFHLVKRRMNLKNDAATHKFCLKEKDYDKFQAAYKPHKKKAVYKSSVEKQDDELSIDEITDRLGTHHHTITTIFKRLQLKEGTEDLYLDPEDKNKESPTLFRMARKQRPGGAVLFLKEQELSKFQQTYNIYNKKQKGELSASDIADRLNTHHQAITTIFKRLQLKEGTEDLYFDPEDKNKESPTLFHMACKQRQGGTVLCLKEQELSKFQQTYTVYGKKQKGELSTNDVAKKIGTSAQFTTLIFYRFLLKEGTEDLYFDPEDKNLENPTLFHMVKRGGAGATRPRLCLKEADLEKFQEIYAPYGPKQNDEFSTVDLTKIFKAESWQITSMFKRLQLKEGTEDLYFDLKDKNPNNQKLFQIVLRKACNGSSRCLKENSLEAFASYYNLEYRDPSKKAGSPKP